MSHLCRLKSQLAKLRTELLTEGSGGGGGAGTGFAVEKVGDGALSNLILVSLKAESMC